jgi:DNA topoisomerase III
MGRQPIDLGWRAAFPEWQPADDKGDVAQLLPAMRDGETARLRDPTIETKETKPPPRYNEGTLIEAMQSAWRFVDDETLRDRLKEAKGIGTPATRAEIIGGLKRQDFLVTRGKSIVPTETGLKLFGVLKQADPALVDPGVTAQLECLLDDVVVGKQEMVGAIDAVCDVALRIIGKLTQGPAAGGPPLFGSEGGRSDGARPPTPAMKRFAIAISRQQRIKLPPGYATSGSICRAFLEQHAPKKAGSETAAQSGYKAAISAQVSVDDSNKPVRKRRRSKDATVAAPAHRRAARAKTARKPRVNGPAVNASPGLSRHDAGGNTPLKIPYGNKEIALKLGARYAAGGWYAPPGVDLSAFKENGWL